MVRKKDQMLGIRFTKEEREIIKTLAKNRNITLTDFVRDAIFSFINNNIEKINSTFFLRKMGGLQQAIETIEFNVSLLKKDVSLMHKEFNIYDLNRIKKELAMEEIF